MRRTVFVGVIRGGREKREMFCSWPFGCEVDNGDSDTCSLHRVKLTQVSPTIAAGKLLHPAFKAS